MMSWMSMSWMSRRTLGIVLLVAGAVASGFLASTLARLDRLGIPVTHRRVLIEAGVAVVCGSGGARLVASTAWCRPQRERDALGALLGDLEAANGPVPSEFLEEADACWPDATGASGASGSQPTT